MLLDAILELSGCKGELLPRFGSVFLVSDEK